MTKLAFAVIRMTRHMMCVLVVMLVPAAALLMHMLFMLVMMLLMPAATVVVLMLLMPVMMMLVSTATVIILILSVPSWALSIMLMLIATAVIVLFRGMLMRMAAAITMAMLRDMPHAGMIVVLATVTTGAAFGMVTIIFIPLNMSVHMSKAAHLLGGITHFF